MLLNVAAPEVAIDRTVVKVLLAKISEPLLTFNKNGADANAKNGCSPDFFTNPILGLLLASIPIIPPSLFTVKLSKNLPVPLTSSLYPASVVVPIPTLPPENKILPTLTPI